MFDKSFWTIYLISQNPQRWSLQTMCILLYNNILTLVSYTIILYFFPEWSHKINITLFVKIISQMFSRSNKWLKTNKDIEQFNLLQFSMSHMFLNNFFLAPYFVVTQGHARLQNPNSDYSYDYKKIHLNIFNLKYKSYTFSLRVSWLVQTTPS